MLASGRPLLELTRAVTMAWIGLLCHGGLLLLSRRRTDITLGAQVKSHERLHGTLLTASGWSGIWD